MDFALPPTQRKYAPAAEVDAPATSPSKKKVAKKIKEDIEAALMFAHEMGVYHLDVRLDVRWSFFLICAD